MFESNTLNYYFFKYSPLGFGLSFIGMTIKGVFSDSVDLFEILIFLIIALIFLILFLSLKDKYRIVAISRGRIIVSENKSEMEYSWMDVESIRLIHFIGIYILKLKRREVIYFTPYGFTSLLFGDSSEMGQIISKKKKDLGI